MQLNPACMLLRICMYLCSSDLLAAQHSHVAVSPKIGVVLSDNVYEVDQHGGFDFCDAFTACVNAQLNLDVQDSKHNAQH